MAKPTVVRINPAVSLAQPRPQRSFRRGRPLSESFRAIAITELEAAITTAAGTDRTPVERIHDVRTNCKRLRALLWLVRTAFPQFEHENAAIRAAADGLAGTRDAAVMEETFTHLLKSADAAHPVRAEILKETPSEDAETWVLGHFLAAARTIRGRAQRWTLNSDALSILADGAGRTYQRAYAGMKLAGSSGRARDFHEWRKQTKFHLYQLGLLEGLKLDICSRSKVVDKLSGILGDHHDLAVLRDFVEEHVGADGDEVDAKADRKQNKLAKMSFKAARQVFVQKPKAWRKRLRKELKA